MSAPQSVTIFCQVIDNFGDAGVCWRLARQLVKQEKLQVTLWMDDLSRLQRLRPMIEPQAERQQVDGITLRRWHEGADFEAPADLVIEAFGCRLPESVIEAMAAALPPPVWINLEYLSAEPWVETCHALPSPHPRLPLKKYFYFPGFTTRTGGLLKESGLDGQRLALQQDPVARRDFLAQLGVSVPPKTTLVSLFCYPSAPLDALFAAMQSGSPVLCLVPEGVADLALARLCPQRLTTGLAHTVGNLQVQRIPFLAPDDYDRLLWCCDLNMVRGEDSLVRAQWAQRPFVWQAYEQEAFAHLDKLQALLDHYVIGLPAALSSTVTQFWRSWNGAPDGRPDWPALQASLPALQAHGEQWGRQLSLQAELARSLIEFAGKIG